MTGVPALSGAARGPAGPTERPPAALLDSGGGPAVVLLHGWGATKELMAPIAGRLDGYRLIVPDLPGFGATPPPADAWGPAEYAAWLLALLDRLGVERAHLVGHSNGGRVAIALAAAHPHRVGRLVLADSAGIRASRSVAARLRVRAFKLLRTASRTTWIPAGLREAAGRRAARSGSEDYRAASGTMRATMVRLVNSDMRVQLAQLEAATLLIWGDRDVDTPLRDAHVMERLIPDSGLVVFEGCGHFAYAEQPDRFARIVDVFLRGVG